MQNCEFTAADVTRLLRDSILEMAGQDIHFSAEAV